MNQGTECSGVLQPSLPAFVAGRRWGEKPNKLSRQGSHRGLLGGGLPGFESLQLSQSDGWSSFV